MIDPTQVMKNNGKGAMHTFTREFYHPNDRVKQVSPAAASRFDEDLRRFPPGAYEEHSLLWQKEQWRQPSPTERAQLLGVPPAAVEAVTGTPDEKRQGRNSLLGNGFHIPSLLAILCLLPALLEAKMIPQPTLPDHGLHERLVGTIWEPGRLQSFPDILDGPAVVARMQGMFDPIVVNNDVWVLIAQRLDACQLHQLQAFASWRRLPGRGLVSTWAYPWSLGGQGHGCLPACLANGMPRIPPKALTTCCLQVLDLRHIWPQPRHCHHLSPHNLGLNLMLSSSLKPFGFGGSAFHCLHNVNAISSDPFTVLFNHWIKLYALTVAWLLQRWRSRRTRPLWPA